MHRLSELDPRIEPMVSARFIETGDLRLRAHAGCQAAKTDGSERLRVTGHISIGSFGNASPYGPSSLRSSGVYFRGWL